jgi:Phytanoyl-CoA dioxygenase (PhyH)
MVVQSDVADDVDQLQRTRYWDHAVRPLDVAFPEFAVPTPLEEYLFDLQGFLLLRGALSRDEVAACNAVVDTIPALERREWWGYVQREDHPEHRGHSYQQIYESGPAFERLIDHPSWINYILRFVGGQDTYDYNHGPLFIDENFVTCRGPGGAIPIHGGSHDRCRRTGYAYHNGRFSSGQINVLIALTGTGPGDGETMLIPGSHKSNIPHPTLLQQGRGRWVTGGSLDGTPGAISVFMDAGDAVLFVDCCCHGSAKRTAPGERRFTVYRYGSTWNRTRWGYTPSEELLARLSPYAAAMVRTTDGSTRPPAPAGRTA